MILSYSIVWFSYHHCWARLLFFVDVGVVDVVTGSYLLFRIIISRCFDVLVVRSCCCYLLIMCCCCCYSWCFYLYCYYYSFVIMLCSSLLSFHCLTFCCYPWLSCCNCNNWGYWCFWLSFSFYWRMSLNQCCSSICLMSQYPVQQQYTSLL